MNDNSLWACFWAAVVVVVLAFLMTYAYSEHLMAKYGYCGNGQTWIRCEK